MSASRVVRGFLALVVVALAAVATLPTIWQDSIINLKTYLGLPHDAAAFVAGTVAALLVGVPSVVRLRRWVRNRRRHRAARTEAVRRLEA